MNNSNSVKNDQIIFIKPAFSHTIWGGSSLREEFGYDEPGNDIGECWGISAHPKGDCEVSEGEYKGCKLSELWREHPGLFGRNASGGKTGRGNDSDVFPLLTKIISARDDLSIQVHPGDTYAAAHENGALGKTECWYVLSAGPGSRLVVGHNAKTKAELDEMIDSGRWDELIRRIEVKPGDVVQIAPGTVHSICGGVTLLETQQSSDITYRLYDYDRLSNGALRQLHIKQSKDVITVPSPDMTDIVTHDDSDEDVVRLVSCDRYEVYRINCRDNLAVEFERPFVLMSVIDGTGDLGKEDGASMHSIKKGDHFIVPFGYGKLTMRGDLKIIASCLPS